MIRGEDGGEVQDLPVATVKHQGIFIGFEAAHQWIDRTVTGAEDGFHLPSDFERVAARQPGFGTLELLRVTVGVMNQPIDPFLDGHAMNADVIFARVWQS